MNLAWRYDVVEENAWLSAKYAGMTQQKADLFTERSSGLETCLSLPSSVALFGANSSLEHESKTKSCSMKSSTDPRTALESQCAVREDAGFVMSYASSVGSSLLVDAKGTLANGVLFLQWWFIVSLFGGGAP